MSSLRERKSTGVDPLAHPKDVAARVASPSHPHRRRVDFSCCLQGGIVKVVRVTGLEPARGGPNQTVCPTGSLTHQGGSILFSCYGWIVTSKWGHAGAARLYDRPTRPSKAPGLCASTQRFGGDSYVTRRYQIPSRSGMRSNYEDKGGTG